ncbi:Protein IDA [Euphorbia peplus]|nr:Protein IDA [Euphorbia peplus]
MVSSHFSCCKNVLINMFVLSLILFNSSCFAARPGISRTVDARILMSSGGEKPDHRKLYRTGFSYGNRMFNFFPKGVPIPPSGPSKRHNSIEN